MTQATITTKNLQNAEATTRHHKNENRTIADLYSMIGWTNPNHCASLKLYCGYKALYDKSYLRSKTTTGELSCLISFARTPLTCKERKEAINSK